MNVGPIPIPQWKNARLGLLWEERSLQAKKTNGFGSSPCENVKSLLTVSSTL